MLGVWAMFVVAGFLAFGPGGGRPIAFVLFFAALAMIRRIFGAAADGPPEGAAAGAGRSPVTLGTLQAPPGDLS